MEIPFIGSDAISAGHLTRAHLRSHYRPLYRGIYVPRRCEVSLRERVVGVSLASPSAVIAGVAASAIHGAKWVGDDVPIELVAAVRRQRGLIVRDETLDEDEVTAVAGIE